MEAVAGSLLGVLFGMRHACEPDHLAAISTLVVEERSARKGLLLGMAWGLGMAALSGRVGWPLAHLGRRAGAARALAVATGLFSIGLGVFWGWPLLTRIVTAG